MTTRLWRWAGPLVVVAGLAVALCWPQANTKAQDSAQGKPTKDLALVPAGALGFAHVRVAEVWASDSMQDVRSFLKKAGPVAFETLDADFTPAPSTLENVTSVLLPFKKPERPELTTVTVLGFSKPFTVDKVVKQYMASALKLKEGGLEYYNDRGAGVAVYFASDSTLVFGDASTIPQYLKLLNDDMVVDRKGKSPIEEHLGKARNKDLYACVNLAGIPLLEMVGKDAPFEFRPLFKAKQLIVQADVKKEMNFELSLQFDNETDATAGEKALRRVVELGRGQLNGYRRSGEEMVTGRPRSKDKPRSADELPQAVMGLMMLAGMNTLDDQLAALPMATKGNTVSVTLKVSGAMAPLAAAAVVSAGVALPAVQKVRNAASLLQSSNNMKQIALAMHNYESAFGTFPAAAICDKRGNKLLSWRVAILPFIEQDNLYRQFKLDEPWDSEHNKKFSSLAVKTYMDPRAEYGADKFNHTHYKLFVGGGAPFDWVKGRNIVSISDGTSNTIMVAAAGDSVPWAKPDDFEFDPKKPLPDLKKPFSELIVAMCDGSVRVLRPEQMKDFDKIMKLLIQADDGMVIPNFDE
jgi:Protein of unknown function (DUF1559)